MQSNRKLSTGGNREKVVPQLIVEVLWALGTYNKQIMENLKAPVLFTGLKNCAIIGNTQGMYLKLVFQNLDDTCSSNYNIVFS